MGYIFEAGEDIPDTLAGASAAAEPMPEAQPAAPELVAELVTEPVASAPVAAATQAASRDGHIKSSPAARLPARELGVDYTQVMGAGPGGRIVEADVQAASQKRCSGCEGRTRRNGNWS
ncbi:MAG: E3 binding domain-containing protein [Candidatus Azotimanducaceae bacterium WSBS_2022_MAG_OTU7]